MDARDRFILESCVGGFRPLKPLTKQIPSGSLYRRAKRLVALGWLRRENDLYQTSEAGLRPLAEGQAGRRVDVLGKSYPTLAPVPPPLPPGLAVPMFAPGGVLVDKNRSERHPLFLAHAGA